MTPMTPSRFRARVWDAASLQMHVIGFFTTDREYHIKAEKDIGSMPLMLSTGLADVWGNEMFEGDIVSITENHVDVDTIGVIEWDGSHRVRVYKHPNKIEKYRYPIKSELQHYVYAWQWAMQVLGNKYQNEELLK